MLKENVYETALGPIHYWVEKTAGAPVTLVFLPGLTADHRLFEKQLPYFSGKYNLFVWDAPGHASSAPFALTFSLLDKAVWLDGILTAEELRRPVIVGQSMGGYVGQAYAGRFPEKLAGFVSVDSAPLQRAYLTGAELWLLKRMEPVYRAFPWKSLLRLGSSGVAATPYGRSLMREMMLCYDGDKTRYVRLVGHGYRILAEAIEAGIPADLRCPALLICGKKDHAGSCIRYARAWHKKTSLPLEWIPGAGHNSNTDAPEAVNALIERVAAQAAKHTETAETPGKGA